MGGRLVGLGCLSGAVLLLEITVGRLFSVSLWYHFAFLVISLALLGLGAAGAWLAGRPLAHPSARALAITAGLFAGAVLGLLGVIGLVPVDPFALRTAPVASGLGLLVYTVATALPFFWAGLTIARLLSAPAAAVGRLYAADLAGAGMGAGVAVICLPLVGAPGAALLAAAGGLVAALCFLGGRSRGGRAAMGVRAGLGLGALLLVGAAILWGQRWPVPVPASKGLAQALAGGARWLWTGWNTISRVDVTQGDLAHYAPGLRQGRLPPQLAVRIDGDALTALTAFDGDLTALADFERALPALAYWWRPGPRVLVIGAGGGPDVLAALRLGAEHVTAVEVNPLVVALVREHFRGFTGDLYRHPRVTAVVGEGRHFVAQPGPAYDLIVLSLVDTWAAVTTGAYSLTENFLYTREALADYYRRLQPGGLVVLTRFERQPPVELLRLLTTVAAGLEMAGVAEPGRQVVVMGNGEQATVFVRRGAFSPEEVATARRFADRYGHHLLLAPGEPASDPRLAQALGPDRDTLIATSPYAIDPVTDDRPFFFQFGRWRSLVWPWNAPDFAGFGSLTTGQTLLLLILGQTTVLSALLVLLPLGRRRPAPGTATLGWFAYFTALGLGFMAVEIALLTQTTLLLGAPTVTMAVVLGGLLVSAGLGSLLSDRLDCSPSSLTPLMLLLAGCLVIWPALTAVATTAFLAAPWLARLGLTLLLVAGPGLLLGLPLPGGLRLLQRHQPDLVPWAWAVNACASVVGPVLAMMGAITFGVRLLFLVAALLYLGGWLSLLLGLRRAEVRLARPLTSTTPTTDS